MAELAQKLQSIVNGWDSCADCNNPYPEWADISRGIIICLQCSGIHRELGTHVSKVRSLTLDVWQSEWVDRMQTSNSAFNEVFEYHVPAEYVKPNENSSRELRTTYITAKYIGLDTSSIELQPLFHRDGPYKDEAPLPPVYDTGGGDDDGDGDDNEEEDMDDPQSPTKNGTRPWRDRRGANNKRHSRTDSGMTHYTGVLHLHCLNAVNLPKGNMMNSKRSTFCVFDNGFQEVSTKVVKKSNHPEWQQKLMLSVNENECIKIAICNDDKKKSVLCHQFLDPKDYPVPDKKYEIREFEMMIHKKYVKDKQYKKEGKKIALNFDLEYSKMSSEIDSDVTKLRENRQSLILDHTKILDSSLSALHSQQVEESVTVDSDDQEERFVDAEHSQIETIHEEHEEQEAKESAGIDEDMDEYDGDSKQDRRDSVELKEEKDDESSPTSSPPPTGRPGDTEDEFVSYARSDEDQYHRVRLTGNISGVVSEMVDDEELQQALQERKEEDDAHELPVMRDEESTVIHSESTQIQSEIEQRDHLQYLVQLNEMQITAQSPIDMNGIIESMDHMLHLQDKQVLDIIVESIRKLNAYLFLQLANESKHSALDHHPAQSRTAEKEQEEELFELIIDRLRDLRNRIMEMNRVSLNLEHVFYRLSDANHEKQYLLQDLNMISPYTLHDGDILKNQLLSSDADNIEHALAEILKMNQTESSKLHEITHLIVECINNNNVNVKKLSVQILAKFSADSYVQQCILSANHEMLRILSIIDHVAFVDISFNIIVKLEIADNRYHAIKKHLAQYLVDEYDDYQYNLDQNHILQLMALENIKQNTFMLKEEQLVQIINEHIDEVEEEDGLNLQFQDMLVIAKSKQILNYQLKTECALIMQSYFRGCHQRKQYQQLYAEHKQSAPQETQIANESLLAENSQLRQALNESERQNTQNSQLLQQQQSEIERLQQLVQTLQRQQESKVSAEDNVNEDLMNKMNALHHENKTLKQERQKQEERIAQQTQHIAVLKQEHLMDKQQFAVTMMDEMNNLRDQLKLIGRQQLLHQQQQKKQQQQTQNGSYFGGLW